MPACGEESNVVKTDALRLLKFRPRSVKEMVFRLRQKGHSGQIVARLIDEFKEKRLLDDRVFAKLWVLSRMNLKPSGKNLIVRELKAKGVHEAVIKEVFEELKSQYDEYELAVPLARRKAERFSGLDKDKAKKKLINFLAARGFSYGTIWELIKEIYPVRGEDSLMGFTEALE